MVTEDVPGGELRVIVAGGGTGGHLFPGLAVADALGRRGRCSVTFVGSSHGIETRVVPKRGYPLRTLPVRALRGQGPVALAASVLRLPACWMAARRILAEIRPDLLIGVGGYASAPAVVAGWSRRTPTILLEQNAHPGATNRVLAQFADRICASFPESLRYFPAERTTLTGNPVRAPIRQETERRGGFSVLIFGGSAGAHRLNEVGVEAMALTANAVGAPRIVHQTGEADLDWVRGRYRELGLDADVRAFIDDMGAAYAGADLIVCRAGATTLAEITALGKAALLVPYPYAADDHQRKNAESLVERGAALMILDRDLSPQRLAEAVAGLRAAPDRLAGMAEKARASGRPDAADRVVDVCLELVERRRRGA
jgi:UDP-N-acetylglucosamine--N-acetylmuramyl-(pentapeptide) pyrophosphoryl-undecaprenol N-acetylglucosamine transferase